MSALLDNDISINETEIAKINMSNVFDNSGRFVVINDSVMREMNE